jgi:cysteine desulfurase
VKAYLDNNATTRVDPIVDERMRLWNTEEYGNASAREHQLGWRAMEAVASGRESVANALAVPAARVVFTSGATEGINAVLRSYVGFRDWPHKTIVTCATEHDAVLAPSRYLCDRTGVTLRVLPVDGCGRIGLGGLAAAIAGTSRALVVLMAANNEIGTCHRVREIAEVVHAAGGLFLCDATQAFGKSDLDLSAEDMDFATISGHKCHGPKGVGALIARDAPDAFEPLLLGGGQERGWRGGTLNVPGIVGLGEACRLVQEHRHEDVPRMARLRDRLEDGVLSQVGDAWVNGDRAYRLCNTSNLGFKGIDGRALIRDMHDIAVSTRSACSSGHSGPSHVLKAIGLSDDDAYSCVRFSLGRFTTQDEIDYAIDKVVTSVNRLRQVKSVRV